MQVKLTRTCALAALTTASIAAAAILPGCIVGGESSIKQSGTFVSPAAVSMIEPGKTSRAWVQTAFGEPSSRVTEVRDGATHELYRYDFKKVSTSSGYVLVVFGGTNRNEISQTTLVQFKNDVVVSVVQAPDAVALRQAESD